MVDLELVVDAERALPLRLVTQTLGDAERVLADVERGVSRRGGRIGEVVIRGATGGSISVELRYRPLDDRHAPVVDRVGKVFFDGLRSLADVSTPPPFFSSNALGILRKMSSRLGAVAGARLVVSNGGQDTTAVIDAETAGQIDELLSSRHEAHGSVIGALEAINIHRRRIARVYREDRHDAVECSFDQGFTDDVARALGRRVVASGVIHRSASGDPLRLELHELETLPDEEELPTINELIGIDPDFTSGLASEDYVAEQRR